MTPEIASSVRTLVASYFLLVLLVLGIGSGGHDCRSLSSWWIDMKGLVQRWSQILNEGCISGRHIFFQRMISEFLLLCLRGVC